MKDNKHFLSAYNRLDNLLKNITNTGDKINLISYYERIIPEKASSELKTIRKFKNSIESHGVLVKGEKPVAPSSYVDFLEEQIRYVKFHKTSVADKLNEQLAASRKKDATHGRTVSYNYDHDPHPTYQKNTKPAQNPEDVLRKEGYTAVYHESVRGEAIVIGIKNFTCVTTDHYTLKQKLSSLHWDRESKQFRKTTYNRFEYKYSFQIKILSESHSYNSHIGCNLFEYKHAENFLDHSILSRELFNDKPIDLSFSSSSDECSFLIFTMNSSVDCFPSRWDNCRVRFSITPNGIIH